MPLRQHLVNAGDGDAEHEMRRDGDPVTGGFKPRKNGGEDIHVHPIHREAEYGSDEQEWRGAQTRYDPFS